MDSDTITDVKIDDLLDGLKDSIEKLLLLLSQKEKTVIEKRFSLIGANKYTLEEIGQQFSVTRERIRQIEKNALQKLRRNIENFDIYEVNNIAYEHLVNNGGFMSEDLMISKLLREKTDKDASSVLLLLCLDKRFVKFPNTILYSPYFKLSDINKNVIDQVCMESERILEKHGDLMQAEDVLRMLDDNLLKQSNLTVESLISIFDIYKKTKVVGKSVGLIKWRHINPRTLRDKIFYVLRKRKKPSHFVDIANLIINSNFDKKTANLQAIHNELIRYPEFILIGRGIYALKEWGYKPGTVADVIKGILKKKKSMSEGDIIESVLKRREVKPITIILNLKNKPQFVRVGRKQYALKS